MQLSAAEQPVLYGGCSRLEWKAGENINQPFFPIFQVTSLSSSQIVCLPPGDSPAATDHLGRRTALPKVTVEIGQNLLYSIGYLRYEMSKLYNLPPEIMGMAATGGAILILVSVLVLALLRHKNSQAEREYKRIQLQMATLENSVRSECKQAFAELQTDLKLEQDSAQNELTKGFCIDVLPPVLSHTRYLENIFFPGVPNTNVFHITKVSSCTVLLRSYYL